MTNLIIIDEEYLIVIKDYHMANISKVRHWFRVERSSMSR